MPGTSWSSTRREERTRKHGIAVEAVMRAYARLLHEDEEKWGITGLLHDFDWEIHPTPDLHPQEGSKILAARGVPADIRYAILCHAPFLGLEYTSTMDRAIYACDELSGFVTRLRPREARQVALRRRTRIRPQEDEGQRPSPGLSTATTCSTARRTSASNSTNTSGSSPKPETGSSPAWSEPVRNERVPDRNIAMELVRTTEAAALAAARWMGRGDKNGADGAAVDAMRLMLDTVDMDGIIVIGEGEKDEAPMLFNGERVGNGRGPQVDVAVDPLEGTRLTALGRPGAVSVIACAPRGTLYNPHDMFYMEKIAVGPAARGCIDLAAPIAWNIEQVAPREGHPRRRSHGHHPRPRPQHRHRRRSPRRRRAHQVHHRRRRPRRRLGRHRRHRRRHDARHRRLA